MHSSLKITLLLSVLSLLSACAVTTGATEGTTETAENTTEASTALTSSTSPRSDDHDHDHHHDDDKDKEAAIHFTEKNYAKVKVDAAAGGGEYLTTVGLLLGVDNERLDEFSKIVQSRYSDIYSAEQAGASHVVASLDDTITENPSLKE